MPKKPQAVQGELEYRQESASVIYWQGTGWYGYRPNSQGDRVYYYCDNDYLNKPDTYAYGVQSMAWYDEPPTWVSYVRYGTP